MRSYLLIKEIPSSHRTNELLIEDELERTRGERDAIHLQLQTSADGVRFLRMALTAALQGRAA